MSTSFKKLLLIFVAYLLVVSFGVSAQTNYYNFSETWNFTAGGTNYSETLKGTFTTDSTAISNTTSYLITGWSNVQLSGTLSGNATTIGTTSTGYGSYNPVTGRFWGPGGGAASATSGTAFLNFGGITNPYGDDRWQMRLITGNSGITAADQLRAYNNGPYVLQGQNIDVVNNVSVSSGGGGGSLGGAPEIDGALAPKVGFLLACLFLMFGRKKKTVEPMLTV